MRLWFNNRIQYPLYAPDDVIDTGKDLTVDDALSFLNRETDDKEVIDLEDKKDDKVDDDKDDDKEDKEDKDPDLKELEDDLDDDKEPSDDDLELISPIRRSEILKLYPDLFEKIPYLEKAYYREQQFTEIFPNPADAKEALDKAETLDKFENDLFEGKTEVILKSVHDNDPKAFAKIVDNYLGTLASVDQASYHHIIGNITKHTIQAMVDEASGMDEESGTKLKIAAQILNQFVFGSSKFTPPSKLSRDEIKDDKSDELDRKEKEYNQTKFNDSVEALNTRVNNSIQSTIEQNLDPKGSMTPFVKKHAISDAVKEVSDILNKDSRFKTIIDKLWEKAAKNNYKKESVDAIRNAYISRAKTVLPTVIKTARNNALKGMGKRVTEEVVDKKGPINRRSDAPDKNVTKDKDSKVPKNMSNLDFMLRDS